VRPVQRVLGGAGSEVRLDGGRFVVLGDGHDELHGAVGRVPPGHPDRGAPVLKAYVGRRAAVGDRGSVGVGRYLVDPGRHGLAGGGWRAAAGCAVRGGRGWSWARSVTATAIAPASTITAATVASTVIRVPRRGGSSPRTSACHAVGSWTCGRGG